MTRSAVLTPRERNVCCCVRRADGGCLRPPRPRCARRGAAVNFDNVVGLVLAVLIAVFLGAALLFPEKF
ncbi:potassium-transporting ATPase subunit F [Antrihabitans sp. YC2-6]|nr:potassium-transporting ATPase subunit F [Antrihabitans sp. YC2-6]